MATNICQNMSQRKCKGCKVVSNKVCKGNNGRLNVTDTIGSWNDPTSIDILQTLIKFSSITLQLKKGFHRRSKIGIIHRKQGNLKTYLE